MKHVFAAVITACLALPAAPALALDHPTGAVILTVTGDITSANEGSGAAFDIAMLERLQGRSAAMETPWTEGVTTFEGPLLRAILDAAGAKGKTLRIKALNDYSADVPMEDATDIDSILAVKMNGRLMSVRDKGPLFMIYPFDLKPELYNEKYFSRSVWQIKEIEVLD